MILRCLWSRWARVLVIVKPETVVSWHRAGFRWYWRFLSRHRPGRPKITSELQKLIRSMATENPTWGAPRIHGELLKLGFEISECTVSRYLGRMKRHGDSGKRWLTFLKNHREAIAAMDFFTVPTATFRRALLLLRDQPQPAENRALQCHGASHQSVDRAAAARSLPGGSCTQVLDP